MATDLLLKGTLPAEGIKRVIIKNITPTVACGSFVAKSAVSTPIAFRATIFADGQAKLHAKVQQRKAGAKKWEELYLASTGNDRWEAWWVPETMGILEFRVQAWISELETWRHRFEVLQQAGLDTTVEQLEGIPVLRNILKEYPECGYKEDIYSFLEERLTGITPEDIPAELFNNLIKISPEGKTTTSKIYRIDVQRQKAQFSTWYEIFPRSTAQQAGKHGTFRDVMAQFPRLSEAGFDVVYFPPIHPIGKKNRKGKNNSLVSIAGEPGSPWAIGNEEGGHKMINRELGSFNDFERLLEAAGKYDLEIALDLAFQCAPDHPYVKKYPQWFKWRPDGNVLYAENPPKKYEDIIPFNFECSDREALWLELLSIVCFWIGKGVRIFRADNPHTKPFRFWKWLITEVRKKYPEVIFLAEAFTRPCIMEHLAMVGFSQSYTYFTWRNTKWELEAYLKELTKGSKQFYFIPNFWPNTPDILPDSLVNGGENAHIIRLLLAATLSSNYGIYGPVFERGINCPLPGKEEYADSEKYEIKYWQPEDESRIWQIIKKTNRLRKRFKALQVTNNIEFLGSGNDQIIAYLKIDRLAQEHLIIIINLDPDQPQSGMIYLDNEATRMFYGTDFKVTDELNQESYIWNGYTNYVALDPGKKPAHIFSISRP